MPFPSPGDLTDPEIEPISLASPTFADRPFTHYATWEAHALHVPNKILIPSRPSVVPYNSIFPYWSAEYQPMHFYL